jgi:hypothetical protein
VDTQILSQQRKTTIRSASIGLTFAKTTKINYLPIKFQFGGQSILAFKDESIQVILKKGEKK